MTCIYGYARVSTTDQDLSIQRATLQAARCTLIREEKQSGTSTAARTELRTLLDFIRAGDTLVVTRIDCLARSIGDMQTIMAELKAKGAALRCTEQPVDTTTAAGKCFLDMLGVFAAFEINLRKERQVEGVAAAKAAGIYNGRKAVIEADKVRALRAKGVGAIEIAKQLGIARASVYRLLREAA